MEHSYHGDTVGAMSLGMRGPFHAGLRERSFRRGSNSVPGTRDKRLCHSPIALEAICAGKKPAAFLVEPLVLGAGGMLMYSPDVLRAMREICARHRVLFIADEVMTGFGRTGTLFACEQAQIKTGHPLLLERANGQVPCRWRPRSRRRKSIRRFTQRIGRTPFTTRVHSPEIQWHARRRLPT